MDKKDLAYNDYVKGMKYKDIALKYEVSESAVKSWASRHWKKKKDATKEKKKLQPTKDKLQPKKPRGAPKGSKNALGNKGGGAPLGNKNNYKHGIYENIYWDTISDEEMEMIQDMHYEEERMLQEQIALLTIRERRLMITINEKKNTKGGLALDSVVSRSLKIEGNIIKGEEQKQTETTTKTISTFEVIQRLEAELTRVQARKTKCIEALSKLRLERLKLNPDEDEYEDDGFLEALKGTISEVWDDDEEI